LAAHGHRRFAVFNRTINPFIRALLLSRAHRLLSGSLLVITISGRRSGRKYSFPVGYKQVGEEVRIGVGWPGRKRWWRNLRGGAPVGLHIRGSERSAWAEAEGDENAGVVVRAVLSEPEGATRG
jgi:hypothetical protein